MIITYLGNNGFRLQSGEVSLLINPPTARTKADIVVRSSIPASTETPSAEEISFPGEYEVKGIEIQGFPLTQESDDATTKTAYRIKWEDIVFAFLGEASQAPEASLLKEFADSDVVLIPSNKKSLSAEDAAKLVHQIEPAVAVGFGDEVKALSKLLNQDAQPQDKFVFKKKDLEEKQARLVVLSE